MPQFNREVIGTLHEKLILTLSKEEFLPKVEEALKKIRKKVIVKGFRQGEAPLDRIKKMHGQEIMGEEIGKLANIALDNYIHQNKIAFLGNPLALPVSGQSMDVNHPSDHVFEFEIGIQPQFEIPSLGANSGIINYSIDITDELVQKELEYEQTRNGKSEEAETIEAEDVLNIDVTSLDGTFSKNINLLISAVKNEAKRSSLLSLVKEATQAFNFEEAYEGDKELLIHKVFNIEHQEADTLDFSTMQITLKKIFRLHKAPIDTVLFETVFPNRNILDVAAFKVALKEELLKVYAKETEKKLQFDVQKKLLELTNMDLPETFLKRWIISVNKQAIDTAKLDAEFSAVIADTKWTLIKNKIVISNQLQVQEKDLRDNVMAYLQQTYQGIDAAFLDDLCTRILSNEKERNYMVEQMIDKRVMDSVIGQSTFENKTISMEAYEHLISHHH